ncbi:ATP-binding protein [Vibrio owensii]|uniref:ATP-binding protein n=1 Tax=Vibrio owensii TaxID=696485 RepID=UPI003394E7AE
MSNRFLQAQTVINSLRDNGYSNTAYALAELIDNSIQAKASRVELGFIENQESAGKRYVVEKISLWDNGLGMTPSTLRKAMQFGGSENQYDTEGMGRFGMGLPNSSISQCKRVEVWSWQNGNKPYYTFLDVDQMATGDLENVPEPVEKEIPKEYLESHFTTFPTSGTFIVWSKLDRLKWKTGKSIFTHCDKLVGRMYRNFIHEDKVKIESRTYRPSGTASLSVWEAKEFKANDPMYLLKNSSLEPLPKPYTNEAFFELYDESKLELTYTKSDGLVVTGTVVIRGSIVKKSIADEILKHSSKRLGSTDWGKDCKANTGVSIVRAGRELVLRDRFLSQSLRESKGRFIGIEVSFPPVLDELFGVTNNKQDAVGLIPYDKEKLASESGFALLSDYMEDLAENDDNLSLVFQVTDRISDIVKKGESELKGISIEPKVRATNSLTVDTPAAKATTGSNHRETHGNATSDYAEKLDQKEVEKVINEAGLSPEVIDDIIEHDLRFHIDSKAMDSEAFFDVSTRAGLTLVLFNTNHVFYSKFMSKLDKEERDTVELAIAGFARVMNEEGKNDARANFLNSIRRAWGKVVTEFVDGPAEEDEDLFV